MAGLAKFAIWFPAAALLLLFALASPATAAVSVSVNPDSAYNSDYIEITLSGCRAGYRIGPRPWPYLGQNGGTEEQPLK